MNARRRIGALSLLTASLLLLATPAPARAQDGDFMDLIRNGKYKELAAKLRQYLDLDKADPALRKYLEMNQRHLERGAPQPSAAREVILIHGAKNDSAFRANPASGGEAIMLPNSIRFQRRRWDDRLSRISAYFKEATSLMGGDGNVRHELEKIIEHHKGGGLGTGANSVKSVMISASTQPIAHFGPPYYILRVSAERAIFNYKGLSGEREVLLPFWVLPNEIVDKVETLEEVKNHPVYQASKLKDVVPQTWGTNPKDNWKIIEQNIRAGRRLLNGVAGLDLFLPPGSPAGADADRAEVERFAEKVRNHGGSVERVAPGDPRLPEGVLARTFLGDDGRPRVLLPEGAVKKIALIEELTHVIQLENEVRRHGAEHVRQTLLGALTGDETARRQVASWEERARRFVLGSLDANDPARRSVEMSISDLAAEMLDPGARAARELGRLTVPELLVHLRRRGMELQPGESLDRATLISKLTNTERAAVERRLAEASRTASTGTVASTGERDRDRERIGRERTRVQTNGFIDRILRSRSRTRDRARR